MAITQCRTLRKARTRKRWVVLGCTFFCTGVHFFLFALGCTFLCPLHRAQNPKVTKIWIVLLVSLFHWCSIHSFFFRRFWEWCLTELFHCTRSTRFHISWGETIRLSMIVSNPVAQADTWESSASSPPKSTSYSSGWSACSAPWASGWSLRGGSMGPGLSRLESRL